MRDLETKATTVALPRWERDLLISATNDIQLVGAYQPHAVQCRYLAHLLWSFHQEEDMPSVQNMLVETMGFLAGVAAKATREVDRERFLTLHKNLQELYSLLAYCQQADALKGS